MRNILIIGAGKSTAYIVKYLTSKSLKENLFIKIGDIDLNSAKNLVDGQKNVNAIEFDIFNKSNSSKEIAQSDIVISMLPAKFHILVAKEC